MAATETVSPEGKADLEKHLCGAIDTHAKVMAYMMEKGFYRPYDMPEQLRLDAKTAETA